MTASEPAGEQHWFKQLFESSPDPTWIIDGNRFVECNQAAVDALGYSDRHAFLNVHPSRLSPPRQPDGQDSFAKAEAMMALAKQNGLHRFEWVHTRANGADFLAEVTLSSVRLQARTVIYCVWRDVSERQRIEETLRQQNDWLNAIIENFPGGVSVVDADLRVVACNQQGRELLDLPQRLFEGPEILFEDIVRYNVSRGDYGPGEPEQQVATLVALARTFQAHKFERVRPNGTVLEIRGMPLPRGGFVTTYIDITERRLAEAQQRIAATAFESQEGMFVTDAQRRILRVNQAFCEITGYSVKEAVGHNPRLLNSGRHDQAFYADLSSALEVQGTWQGEIWERRKNGEIFPAWLQITVVRDDSGEVCNYVAALTDITSRKLADEEIKNLAFHDALTKLPNRRLLNDRLSQTLAACKRGASVGALMVLDLDNFKPINDVHGHEVGDLLLIEAAQRLKVCVREVDTVARFGGDEFVVVLGELDTEVGAATLKAERVAEKIRRALSERYVLLVRQDGQEEVRVEHSCTASIGVAMYIDLQTRQEDLLKWADMAMYKAKEAGRNTVRFHHGAHEH